jgi:hypothetical protein
MMPNPWPPHEQVTVDVINAIFIVRWRGVELLLGLPGLRYVRKRDYCP